METGQTRGDAGTQSQGPVRSGSPATRLGGNDVRTIRRLAMSAVIALAFGALAPSTVATAGGSGSCYRYKESEVDFAKRMNLARSLAGVGRLELDKQLSRVARHHAWEMWDKHTLYHTPSDKLRWRVTRWNMLGENVGVGGSVLDLHQAFMNSPAHRENILRGRYQHVGVGVKKSDNYIWVTVIFEARRDPGTRLRLCI